MIGAEPSRPNSSPSRPGQQSVLHAAEVHSRHGVLKSQVEAGGKLLEEGADTGRGRHRIVKAAKLGRDLVRSDAEVRHRRLVCLWPEKRSSSLLQMMRGPSSGSISTQGPRRYCEGRRWRSRRGRRARRAQERRAKGAASLQRIGCKFGRNSCAGDKGRQQGARAAPPKIPVSGAEVGIAPRRLTVKTPERVNRASPQKVPLLRFG